MLSARTLLLAHACLAARAAPLPPGRLIAAYATACNASVVERAREGVNVLYWFAISLAYNETTKRPFISYGAPDLECIANVSATLKREQLPTAHMLTIGGWDAPHPDTRATAADAYAEFRDWNARVASRPGFETGFDGIDWDLEGNDDAKSPFNTFTVDVLIYVGEFSSLAKADGMVVSMVPPESYLDPNTAPFFSTSLLLGYPSDDVHNFTCVNSTLPLVRAPGPHPSAPCPTEQLPRPQLLRVSPCKMALRLRRRARTAIRDLQPP